MNRIDGGPVRRVFHGELALALGITLLGMSLAFYAKGDMGMSTLSLMAFVMSRVVPAASFGTWNYIIQCAMMLVLVLLLKKIKPGYFISFGLAIVYGLLVDFFSFFVAMLPDGLLPRGLCYLAGFCGMAAGTALLLKSGMPILPFDTFMRDITLNYDIPYRKIRTGFDISTFAFSALLGMTCLGSFQGIGPGTLVNVALMGLAVSKVSEFLDRRFVFRVLSRRLGSLSS